MERKYKVYITSLIILMLVVLTVLLSLFNQIELIIVTVTLIVVVLIYLITLILGMSSSKYNYNKELNYILKTYKNILVKSLDLVNLTKKNIIRTDNIEDLVNAQVEVRKPIYYKCYEDCATFILLLENEALVLVLKENDFVKDPLEYFTFDSMVDLNKIEDYEVLSFRNKKIKIEVLNDENNEENIVKNIKRKSKTKK